MSAVKVVVLGGSAVATPALIDAIIHNPQRSQRIELMLVSRTLSTLERVAGVAGLLAGADDLLKVSHTDDIESALIGADYVINQIRVGGLKGRAVDESFPRELGLPGEETVGPGGFASAYRTIPVVLEYARLMEQACPNTVMLNFANPSSLLHYALARYSKIPTIGLCNGPVMVVETIAKALGAPVDELVVDYMGMHHFGWVTGVWRDGKDVLADVLDKAAEVSHGVEPALVQALGAIPGPYLNYVFHPDRMLARQQGKRTRAEELLELQDEILDEYETALERGERPSGLARRKARWYEDIVAPVLLALVEGKHPRSENRVWRFYLNVVNGTVIPWLPPEAIVEVPTIVENGRIRPLAIGSAPADVKALVQANCAYEMLAVEAIVERDRNKALRSLLMNPIIHTYDQAVGVLDRVWSE